MQIRNETTKITMHPTNNRSSPDNAGTSSWPSWISHFTGSFVGHSPSEMLCPPALFRKGEDGRKKKREVLHLFRCYTRTHPARAGSTLKGKRKKKERTHDGQTAKNSAGGGGEQTDLRNQPTRRNGPDQNSAHT